MMAVCLRYARHRLEAEDLLQDSFVRVFNKLHTFRQNGSLEGWIRRITVNICIRNYRKFEFSREEIGLENRPEDSEDPEVFGSMGVSELMELVQALPDGYRVVFNLYAVEGYSHKEIAEQLGITVSTSRTQLLKARKRLQQQVQELQRVRV